MKIRVVRSGATRWVLLVGDYAVKIPSLWSWRTFLWGLLANMQEAEFGKLGWPELVPILFRLPFGLLIVMPKVRVMSEAEFEAFDYTAFSITNDGRHLPVEEKPDSFGWLHGRVVAIDFGGCGR